MGKYMKKAKATDEVSVMEVPHNSSLGVRTRATTLALQRLQRPSSSPPPEPSSYLQLRSRRLEKPPAPKPKAPPFKQTPSPSPSPSPYPSPYPSPGSSHSRLGSGAGNFGSVSVWSCCSKRVDDSPESDAGVEVSFGENVLELEARGRNTRESTPCSLIRNSESIGTPGSTTRPTNSTANRRPQNSALRNIPTAQEIEDFFSGPEKLQQKMFAEKYNFDPVKDRPLPGRFEWVKTG